MFGHGFDKLVYALLCGGDTKFKLPKAENGNVFFLTRVRFARQEKVFEGTLVIDLILRSLWGLHKIHETLWFYLVAL